jgi:hypothetical protein
MSLRFIHSFICIEKGLEVTRQTADSYGLDVGIMGKRNGHRILCTYVLLNCFPLTIPFVQK